MTHMAGEGLVGHVIQFKKSSSVRSENRLSEVFGSVTLVLLAVTKKGYSNVTHVGEGAQQVT